MNGKFKRRISGFNPEQLVKWGKIFYEGRHITTCTPNHQNLDINLWLQNNRSLWNEILLKQGAILFRGFDVVNPERLVSFSSSCIDSLIEYNERRSPRTDLANKVYSSTIYPKDQEIHFHNASSYATKWPLKIWFACFHPPEKGGMTPLADSRKVLEHIPKDLVEKFERLGILYVRNFHDELGSTTWQYTFKTDDKKVLESYCEKYGIQYEWINGTRLRTKQVRKAIGVHPITQEKSWFNQAHHFHIGSLPQGIRDSILSSYPIDNLPRHAFFGDGSEISNEELNAILDAYEKERINFTWEKGDVVMIENMLMAHSRTSYEGDRLIALSLADLYQSEYILKTN